MNEVTRTAKVGLRFPVYVRLLLPRHLLNEVSKFQRGVLVYHAKSLSVPWNDKRRHNLLEGGGGGEGSSEGTEFTRTSLVAYRGLFQKASRTQTASVAPDREKILQ